MATKLSYTEPTNREDLTNVITNISPEQTPLVSMFKTTTCSSTYHEWPEDELAAAADNAHAEGESITAEATGSRTRKGNHTQILRKTYSVSATQEAVSSAGVSSEYAYAQMKSMKEIAKDLEYALTKNTTDNAGKAATDSAAAVASRMAGVPGCVKTNVLDNKGTARAITMSLITEALRKAWEAGGEPDKLICSGNQKVAISGLTTSNTKNIDAKKKEIVEAVDVIDTNFGRVEIVASRFMADDSVYVIDPNYFKVAYLRKFQKHDLPDTFDGKAGFIVGEATLEGRGEKGQAIIKDLKI